MQTFRKQSCPQSLYKVSYFQELVSNFVAPIGYGQLHSSLAAFLVMLSKFWPLGIGNRYVYTSGIMTNAQNISPDFFTFSLIIFSIFGKNL